MLFSLRIFVSSCSEIGILSVVVTMVTSVCYGLVFSNRFFCALGSVSSFCWFDRSYDACFTYMDHRDESSIFHRERPPHGALVRSAFFVFVLHVVL